MKKSNRYKGKKQLSKKQIKAMKNNPLYALVNAKSELEIIIALAVISVPIVKGKLGYEIGAQDGVFLFNSRAIHTALLADTGGYYLPPFSGMALLDTAINDFETAVNNVRDGVNGAEGAKMVAKRALMKMLKKALNFINDLAFDDQINAVEIITGAKMLVNKPIKQDKQDFSVKQGPGTGYVALACMAIRIGRKYYKASYEWQFSIDNGKTWENLPVTIKAKTIAFGMLPGIATLFRKRTFSEKTGLSAWCDPIMFIPM